MSMEMSDRDKQLLYIVVAIAIIAAAYFFGWKNFSDKKDSYKSQAEKYNQEYSDLIVHQKNRSEYQRLTTELEEQREDVLLAMYQDGYTQENFLKAVADIEIADGVWIEEMEFSEPAMIYEFTSLESTQGYDNTSEIVFQGGYEETKTFLNSLLTMDSKTAFEEIHLEYDEEFQILEGELLMHHYSITGLETEDPYTELDLPVGVDNIFDSDAVTSNTKTEGEEASYILSDYDVCVVISPDKADHDSVIVGTTNDSKAKDSLSYDENETVELTITFDGKDGKYTVSYKLGDETYPAKKYEEGTEFKPGETMDLLVLSSVRENNKDKVAVRANVINNSDMKLNVLVSGDDPSSPRFTAASREGDVVIYR